MDCRILAIAEDITVSAEVLEIERERGREMEERCEGEGCQQVYM
jgi:hypothetical protein